MHERNSFITLTYNDQHLPADFSLNVEHWQHFAKRLRKKIGPFRFYHCGEYGEGKGKRPINPHYHAVIFGQDFSFDRKFDKYTSQGHKTYTSKILTETWGKGICHIGSMTSQSAAYVARYCMKKQGGKKAEAHYQGRKPEYATMSRRPGLGATWLQKYIKDVYPHDFVVSPEGQKTRVPSYYDSQLSDEELESLKKLRVLNARKHSANNTPERLGVREQVLESKLSTLSRTL